MPGNHLAMCAGWTVRTGIFINTAVCTEFLQVSFACQIVRDLERHTCRDIHRLGNLQQALRFFNLDGF